MTTIRDLEYVTVAEATHILRVGPWPIIKEIRAGRLTAFQPGGTSTPWLIRPADLRAYVEGVQPIQ